MTDQKQQKQRVLDSDAENERKERQGTQDRGNLPVDSVRNRDTGVQRSNRQGDGKPTQQRVDDR